MEELNNKEHKIEMAMVAHEVGFEAIGSIINYYQEMLVACIVELAHTTGEHPSLIKERLERELGLTNMLDNNLSSLRAATEYNKELLGFED